MKTRLSFIVALWGLFCPTAFGQISISFDTTTTTPWQVSGGGALNATPFFLNVPYTTPSGGISNFDVISVTSTGDSTGNFMSGGSLANFTGFWVADFTFNLPQNAVGISLNYQNVIADDRAVLTLNGQTIDAIGIQDGGPGAMVLTENGILQPYSFRNLFSSGTITSGFNIGGANIFEVIMNNTGTGIRGPDRALSPGDNTFLGIQGTITYSVVPEPSAISLLGLSILMLWRIRKISLKQVWPEY